MKLKFVVPDLEKTFGAMTFAGAGQERSQNVGGGRRVVSKRCNFYSSIQKADSLEVILPGKAGAKRYPYETPVTLVNPRLNITGYVVGGRGYVNYTLNADDMLSLEEAAMEKTAGGVPGNGAAGR